MDHLKLEAEYDQALAGLVESVIKNDDLEAITTIVKTYMLASVVHGEPILGSLLGIGLINLQLAILRQKECNDNLD